MKIANVGSLALGCVLLTWPVWAQDPLYSQPQMDARGNWLTNAGPVYGQVQSPQIPGALWRVVAPHLNCRTQPRRSAKVVHTFKRGALVQANLGRGGSDEVLYNALDLGKNPWMWVVGPQGQPYACFVRAHRSLIQPLNK